MPQPTAVNPITKDVLLSQREEYVKKRTLYQNTVIAIEGAIEALDDLLKLYDDGIPLEDFAKQLGAVSAEIVTNDSEVPA